MVQVHGRLVAGALVVALATLALVGSTGSGAQDATPMAGAAAGSFPNHIHEGTCDNLNPQPLVPLADLQFRTGMMGGMQASPVASPIASPIAGMATPMAGMTMGAGVIPVAVATTQIDMSVSDILAGQHAINLHDSEDIARYIACGAIGGAPDEQGNLFVGLAEQNGSGYHGVAWLLDDGTGQGTTVTVFLAYEGMGTMGGADTETMASPMASPSM